MHARLEAAAQEHERPEAAARSMHSRRRWLKSTHAWGRRLGERTPGGGSSNARPEAAARSAHARRRQLKSTRARRRRAPSTHARRRRLKSTHTRRRRLGARTPGGGSSRSLRGTPMRQMFLCRRQPCRCEDEGCKCRTWILGMLHSRSTVIHVPTECSSWKPPVW